MKWMQRSILGLFAAGALSLGLAGPATAQIQDGLVNVSIGDITVLEDVNIGVAAQVVANVCGVKVGPVAVLGRAVDRTGEEQVVCDADTGEVVIFQN